MLTSLLAWFLAACAGAGAAAGGPRPSSAFTQTDARLFEDGVDYLADPSALGGRWGEDWDRDMRQRMDASDLVLIVSITTLRTDVDPQQRTSYGLVTQRHEVLKGQLPGGDLTLAVTDDAVGFASIDRDKQRVLAERFVLLLKWYRKADGTVAGHFHLSLASDAVVGQVRSHLGHSGPSNQTIIERSVPSP